MRAKETGVKGGKGGRKKMYLSGIFFCFLRQGKKIVYSSAEKNPSIDEKNRLGKCKGGVFKETKIRVSGELKTVMVFIGPWS